MKYQVIGWTEYDDSQFETAPYTEAVCQAIIDDIRTHGYLFTGYAHQEYPLCAPVLNDGKKRLFTQRNWGDLMAKARGEFNPMAYALYSFTFRKGEKETLPSADRLAKPQTAPQKDLRETFFIPIEKEQLQSVRETGQLITPLTENLRFLDAGDTLMLQAEPYEVTGVQWGCDYAEGQGKTQYISLSDLLDKYYFSPSKSEKDKAERVYEHGKRILLISLRKTDGT